MPRQISLLLVLVAAVAGLALGAAGCGSDQTASDEVPGAPPELTIPKSGSEGDPLADESAGDSSSSSSQDEDTGNASDSGSEDTTADTTGGTAPAQSDTGGGATGGGGQGGTTGGGGTSGTTGGTPSQGQPQQDAQNNQQQPAQGTPPDKFEEFCDENAGAC